MNKGVFILLAALLYFLPASPCPAHSINVFAHIEDGIVKGEGYLSGGKKVVNGTVQVFNMETGVLLLTIHTDSQGLFSFPIAELGLDRPINLRIVLDGAPGHRSQWEISADQYDPIGQAQDSAGPEGTTPPQTKNTAPPATPPLINILAGMVCIFGLGVIIAFIKSRKRGTS